MKTEQEQLAWESHPDGLPGKLLRLLEERTQQPGIAYAEAPAPLGGGHWASLYRFRLAPAPSELAGTLVLRVMPTGDEQCRREAAIQGAVAAAGLPAPRVHFSGGRDAGLGFPFMIMAHVPGGTPTLWGLPGVMAETMAQLHALDERAVSPALAGMEARSVGSALADLEARAQPLAAAGFAAGAAWLRRHEPAPRRLALCHGDLHPFNLLMAEGRVSGVLDWTQALLADPAFDVAYTAQLIALWPLELPGVPRPLGRIFGRLAARRFLAAYRRHARAVPGELSWYEAFHALRLLLRVALARLGHTVPPLPRSHPWELVADDASHAFRLRSGIRVELPKP